MPLLGQAAFPMAGYDGNVTDFANVFRYTRDVEYEYSVAEGAQEGVVPEPPSGHLLGAQEWSRKATYPILNVLSYHPYSQIWSEIISLIITARCS